MIYDSSYLIISIPSLFFYFSKLKHLKLFFKSIFLLFYFYFIFFIILEFYRNSNLYLAWNKIYRPSYATIPRNATHRVDAKHGKLQLPNKMFICSNSFFLEIYIYVTINFIFAHSSLLRKFYLVSYPSPIYKFKFRT